MDSSIQLKNKIKNDILLTSSSDSIGKFFFSKEIYSALLRIKWQSFVRKKFDEIEKER